MNEAFAHDEIYPHIHPHVSVTHLTDIVLTLLYLLFVFGLIFMFLKLGVMFLKRMNRQK